MAHTINDYLELITSQYQNSPKYKKWVERLLTPYIDTQKLASTLYTYFDIDKAVGKQLDMLGEVIGVKRLLPFQPEGSGTGTPNPIFNKSAFTVIGNPTITDDGIASGFSNSNYLTASYNLKENSVYGFTVSGIAGSPYTKRGQYLLNARYSEATDFGLRVLVTAKTNVIRFALGRDYADVYTDIILKENQKYKLTVTTDFKTFATVKDELTGYTKTRSDYAVTNQLYGNNLLELGNLENENASLVRGSIDLKAFSITVDGEEVFSGSQLNPLLDDENYRFLLKAQILRNVWNGTNQHIYEIWNELHSDIAIAIKDNQDMTVTALFIGDLNKLQQEMIKYGMIVPKAQGVKMFYAFSLPPLFSYDQDTEYFKGYDEGNWAENII